MSSDLLILIFTAGSIGFIHTVLGPDHYLPFIVMSQSRKWSLRKTTVVTIICGMGHVLSSILLGIIGISFGVAVTNFEIIESSRGSIAAWALITFGFVYLVWGIRRAIRSKPHSHSHAHIDGVIHEHNHRHIKGHSHTHIQKSGKNVTPWALFIIFILGPCEPLIPIFMYPAAKGSISTMIFISIAFGSVTIITMLGIVMISVFGFRFLPVAKFEQYTHAIAGVTILFCGLSIQLFSL
jgi:sulfite exporter TauE/SafE